IIKVHEVEWEKQSPPFDKFTALRIKDAGMAESNGASDEKPTVYDFYVNMDNLYLHSEMKPVGSEPELLRNRFIYGNVLLGLALVHPEGLDQKARRDKRNKEGDNDENGEPEVNIEERIAQFTRAIGPVLLPMVESLGGLEMGELATADAAAGEAT